MTLTSGETVSVPANTVVTNANGSQITIFGDHDSIALSAGAVVQVPATATGAADNVLTASSSLSTAATANVTLLAGSATTNLNPVDGTGAAAVFWGGGQIVVDSAGNLIVSDRGALRRVTSAGVVTTIETAASQQWQALTMDAAGNLFDSANNVDSSATFGASLVELDAAGQVSVPYSQWETGGPSVGWGGLAVDAADNLYLADSGTNRILKFAAAGGSMTVLAGSGAAGDVDGTGAAASFDFSADAGLAIDAQGMLYVLSDNNLRKITPLGVTTTIASNLPGISSSGPLAIDAAGNFYFGISESVLRLDVHGALSTYAKLSTNDFITSIATDSGGNVYVGTRGLGAEIFKITP